MTKSKHTPGPWIVDLDDQDAVFRGDRPETVYELWTEDHAVTIGYLCYEGTADAHLIAAAPDLLAALETTRHGIAQIRRTLDGSQPKDIPGAVMALDWLSGDLSAVIARANPTEQGGAK